MSIDVAAGNPSATIADVLTDEAGANPVRVNYHAVLSPDGSTQIYIDVADDQTGLGLTGDQTFGICDSFGNPRAYLTLHSFEGQPGEEVEITVTVDDYPPTVITIGDVDGVAMQYPVPLGNARQIAHIPPQPVADEASA